MNTELNKLHMEKVSRDKKKSDILNDITNNVTENIIEEKNSKVISNNIEEEDSEEENSEIILNDSLVEKENIEINSNNEIKFIEEERTDNHLETTITDNIDEKKRETIFDTEKDISNDTIKRCRICYEEDDSISPLLYPCKCNGSIKWVHEKCIQEWITISNKNYCPQCKYTYQIKKTCNYPKLSFLGKERNVRFISLFTMVLLVLIMGLLKYFTIGMKDSSKIRFLLDGLKGLIIVSIIIVPIMYYKKWIDMNSIYSELYGNTVFMGSSIGDISGFIFLIINNIMNKIVNKYIKFEDKIQNYNILSSN